MFPYLTEVTVRYGSRAILLLAFACSVTAMAAAADAWPSTPYADARARPIPGYFEVSPHAATSRDDRLISSYDWKASSARRPDWRGIKRDTGYFVGYQFAAIGILYVAPESVSEWSDEQKQKNSFEKWKRNAGHPVWDEDKWWINYVLHPYWGGAYYVRARERGFDHLQSFAYSALLSTLFEFGAEALFEQPSYQDLIVTPVAGYAVGRYLFMPLRNAIRARPGRPGWSEKTVLFLTDPMGVTNAAIDRVLGVRARADLRFGPTIPADRPASTDNDDTRPPSASNASRGWMLQLRVSW